MINNGSEYKERILNIPRKADKRIAFHRIFCTFVKDGTVMKHSPAMIEYEHNH